jgi:hypothetical protein
MVEGPGGSARTQSGALPRTPSFESPEEGPSCLQAYFFYPFSLIHQCSLPNEDSYDEREGLNLGSISSAEKLHRLQRDFQLQVERLEHDFRLEQESHCLTKQLLSSAMAEIAEPRTRLEGEYARALRDFLIMDLSTAECRDSLREAVVKLEALTSGLEKAEVHIELP